MKGQGTFKQLAFSLQGSLQKIQCTIYRPGVPKQWHVMLIHYETGTWRLGWGGGSPMRKHQRYMTPAVMMSPAPQAPSPPTLLPCQAGNGLGLLTCPAPMWRSPWSSLMNLGISLPDSMLECGASASNISKRLSLPNFLFTYLVCMPRLHRISPPWYRRYCGGCMW